MSNQNELDKEIQEFQKVVDNIGIDLEKCAFSEKIRVAIAANDEFSDEAICKVLGVDLTAYRNIVEKVDHSIRERNKRHALAYDRIVRLYDEAGVIPDIEESIQTLKDEGFGDISKDFLLGNFYVIHSMAEDTKKDIEEACKGYES